VTKGRIIAPELCDAVVMALCRPHILIADEREKKKYPVVNVSSGR